MGQWDHHSAFSALSSCQHVACQCMCLLQSLISLSAAPTTLSLAAALQEKCKRLTPNQIQVLTVVFF